MNHPVLERLALELLESEMVGADSIRLVPPTAHRSVPGLSTKYEGLDVTALTLDFYVDWQTKLVTLTRLRSEARRLLAENPHTLSNVIPSYLRLKADVDELEAAHLKALTQVEEQELRARLLAIDTRYRASRSGQGLGQPMDVMALARALRHEFESWLSTSDATTGLVKRTKSMINKPVTVQRVH